jgi:hypothetical protein
MAALDPDANRFRMTRIVGRSPAGTREFAINASDPADAKRSSSARFLPR